MKWEIKPIEMVLTLSLEKSKLEYFLTRCLLEKKSSIF